MSDLAARYADDPEASAFYALALAASNDPTDQTYASLLKAGAILERLAPAQPDHPGFVHYIIHAYDVPPLAAKALAAARGYAKIAPSAPHALHMPSHTFTRLGYWQDSIDTNIASAPGRAAGGCDGRRAARDGLSDVRLSADGAGWRGAATDRDAARTSRLGSIRRRGGSAAPPLAGVFALAAIPARYALERQAWAEAAKLELRSSRFPQADAITWFARGLGAARTGDVAGRARRHRRPAAARGSAREGGRELLGRAGRDPAARRLRVDGVRRTAGPTRRLTTMRRPRTARTAPRRTPSRPDRLRPARELLGYMLLAANRPADALAAFETTLKKEPNRFLALAGAADAARQNGDMARESDLRAAAADSRGARRRVRTPAARRRPGNSSEQVAD